MKIESVSEKVILSSIAASVALASPLTVEANSKISNDIFIDLDESFSYGQQGMKVRSIQYKLLNYDLQAIEDDGVYGIKTHAAIRKFQKLKKLSVDGVAGSETLTALFINEDIDEVEVEDHVLIKIKEGQFFQFGDTGTAVKEIQKYLTESGDYHYEIDGLFGPLTQSAVEQYQQEHGLEINGIVDKETYKHLAGISIKAKNEMKKEDYSHSAIYAPQEDLQHIPPPILVETVEVINKDDINTADFLQNGDRGQAVKDLQSLLKSKGYYQYYVDGLFGPITEAAVRSYQINNQLIIDGIAGPQTIRHLQTAQSRPPASRGGNPSPSTQTATSSVNVSDTAIIQTAKSYIGSRYVWGGTTPSGFDCSGFLMYVFKQNGKNIPRTVIDIWNFGQTVTNLQPGDIVFYQTYKRGPSHAGIYLGNQQFIHAGSSTGVTISNMNESYWSSKYLGAKRIQ